MIRRYELTDEECEQIKERFPPQTMSRPRKDARLMFNAPPFGLPEVEPPGVIYLNAMVHGKRCTVAFVIGVMMEPLRQFSSN